MYQYRRQCVVSSEQSECTLTFYPLVIMATEGAAAVVVIEKLEAVLKRVSALEEFVWGDEVALKRVSELGRESLFGGTRLLTELGREVQAIKKQSS